MRFFKKLNKVLKALQWTEKSLSDNKKVYVNETTGIDLFVNYYEDLLGISDDDLIGGSRNHFFSDTYKVINLEYVFATKNIIGRQHDLNDIKLIYGALKRNALKNWDWLLVKDHFRVLREPVFDRSLQEGSRLWNIGRIFVHPALLLSLQYREDQFNAIDTCVRFKAIDDYMNSKKAGIDLYKEMQWKRGKYLTWDSFRSLIESIKHNGFKNDFPIELDTHGTLIDGSHRLACALYFGINSIPVTCSKNHFDRDYKFEWFQRVSFSKTGLKEILSAKELLFKKAGLLFPIILWPSSQPWQSEIINDIKEQFDVSKVYNFCLNQTTFHSFATDICETDKISQWKLERKLAVMKLNEKLGVKVILAEITRPNWRKKELDMTLSVEMENFKRGIRKKYMELVPNYIQDILIHIPDNPEQNQLIYKIISKFEGKSV